MLRALADGVLLQDPGTPGEFEIEITADGPITVWEWIWTPPIVRSRIIDALDAREGHCQVDENSVSLIHKLLGPTPVGSPTRWG